MSSPAGRVLQGRWRGIVLVLVFAGICVAASGCDVSPPAATVNGVGITRAELDSRAFRTRSIAGTPAASWSRRGGASRARSQAWVDPR